MKSILKGYIAGLVSATLLTTIVFAEPFKVDISAVYDNIKIYVDGILIHPRDGNGNSVEPFIYNGTTYLPVRAVSEALGKKVTW
ncbi:MAG: cell wall-binding protein, partial [Clostridiaceae bacterium]|nr:cell wall-binding protein [Clostridiaceae bacterium]